MSSNTSAFKLDGLQLQLYSTGKRNKLQRRSTPELQKFKCFSSLPLIKKNKNREAIQKNSPKLMQLMISYFFSNIKPQNIFFWKTLKVWYLRPMSFYLAALCIRSNIIRQPHVCNKILCGGLSQYFHFKTFIVIYLFNGIVFIPYIYLQPSLIIPSKCVKIVDSYTVCSKVNDRSIGGFTIKWVYTLIMKYISVNSINRQII